jgi:hypothetical protein
MHFEERSPANVSRAARACGIKTDIAANLTSSHFDIKAHDAAGCLSLLARGTIGREGTT